MKKIRHYGLILIMCILVSTMLYASVGRLYTSDKLSSSLITCMCQDKYGYIWIGTEYGLNKFDGYRFTNYLHSDKDTMTITDNIISSFIVDRDGQLWVGCGKGLVKYDYHHDHFIRKVFPIKEHPRVNSMVLNNKGDLLIGTAGYGLFKINRGSKNIIEEKNFVKRPQDKFYSRIYVDEHGNLWKSSHLSVFSCIKIKNGNPVTIRDFNSPCGPPMTFLKYNTDNLLIVCMYGILQYNYSTGRMSDAGYDLTELKGNNVSMRKAIIDHAGNLYVGTLGSGLMVIPKGGRKLVKVENNNGSFSLASSNANSVIEDKDNNLWVGCYKKGLLLLNDRKAAFSTWSFSAQNLVIGSSVSSMVKGDHGDTWCTVQNNGVYRFDMKGKIVSHPSSPVGTNIIYRDAQGRYWLGSENGLYIYNPITGNYQLKQSFQGWGLNCMVDDGKGNLYISNFGKGLCIYNITTEKSITYSMNQQHKKGTLLNDWIMSMRFDHAGLLWIGTSNGLVCFNPKNGDFRPFGWQDSPLKGMQCTALSEMSDGNILIGTDCGLFLFNRSSKNISRFPKSEQISDKVIGGIVIDRSGDIWLGTSMGIWQYKMLSKRFIGHISGNGLTTKEYIIGTQMHRSDDMIGFGTSDGITTFYPETVKKNGIKMGELYLTNFIQGGRSIDCLSNHFEIPYSENSFSMEFSLLNYKNTDNIGLQYRINGAKEWMSTNEGNNVISFNKLRPGKYVIEVRAYNNGVHSQYAKTITVVVDEPWYASTLACIIYIVIISWVVYMIGAYYTRTKKTQLEEDKMKFLINATHDIRSPLTLIMGPLENLKKRLTDRDNQMDIETIDRNAKRLLLLVNQILDERKIDKNQMHLHCSKTEMVGFISGILTLYKYTAKERNIEINFEHKDKELYLWVDKINFDKVISNLLSNAFKYTFDGGSITVLLSQNEQSATIKVIDSGIGFSDEKTERLFERFYQGNNSKDLHIEGSGIGLNLCKAIVNMHSGTIKASNRDDGQKGACLTVNMPLGNSHLRPEQIETKDADETADDDAAKKHANKNYRIMVVDDDREIGQYINTELGNWYKFEYFPNGREALKALLTKNYDLVISDVMMPEMDGITLLKNIKTNSNISHIPVLLLTSKAEVSDRLEGLKKGADAFLAKPFSMQELHILIDNLIDNVRRLKGKFSGAQEQKDKIVEVKVVGNDDALMDRIMKSINENLADPDYNIERLTEDVGISRAQLHRKMKEITGISTGEFIRNLRLEQAARLIREGKINVTQVAYTVGFNNQSHFSTLFKKHFGSTPTEYSQVHDK